MRSDSLKVTLSPHVIRFNETACREIQQSQIPGTDSVEVVLRRKNSSSDVVNRLRPGAVAFEKEHVLAFQSEHRCVARTLSPTPLSFLFASTSGVRPAHSLIIKVVPSKQTVLYSSNIKPQVSPRRFIFASGVKMTLF